MKTKIRTSALRDLEKILPGPEAEWARNKLMSTHMLNDGVDRLLKAGAPAEDLPVKLNVLMLGPEGVARRAVAALAAGTGSVLFECSASELAATGYVGLHACDILYGLRTKAGHDPWRAETGIVFVSGIDACRRRDLQGDDVSAAAGAANLGPLLAGAGSVMVGRGEDRTPMSCRRVKVFASGECLDVLEILRNRKAGRRTELGGGAGAARAGIDETDLRCVDPEALIAARFEPGFVGQFAVRVVLPELDLAAQQRALRAADHPKLTQLRKAVAEVFGTILQFEPGALEALAGRLDRDAGVLDLLWDRIAETDLSSAARLIIDRACVDGAPPWVVPGEKGDGEVLGNWIDEQIDAMPAHPLYSRSLPTYVTDTNGWTEADMRARYQRLRPRIAASADAAATAWWAKFEVQLANQPWLLLRLSEELWARRPHGTIAALMAASGHCATVAAALSYLDYQFFAGKAATKGELPMPNTSELAPSRPPDKPPDAGDPTPIRRRRPRRPRTGGAGRRDDQAEGTGQGGQDPP